ncbi:MAG: putative sortase [Candidatus Peregrinibacteria bacterium Greene1014_49]|nr:MAG: putative sortase [Candidatus Peregrinibacteria bacterium Greene1014_49]
MRYTDALLAVFLYNPLIPLDPLQHRAEILPDGSIVLPGELAKPIQQPMVEKTIVDTPIGLWTETEQEEETIAKALKAGQLSAYRAAINVVAESKEQYALSARDFGSVIRNSKGIFQNGGRVTWAFLTQPVWIVAKNKTPKQYNRGTLFVVDTVRFGGTFAALFAALFLTLNYQSFWAIVGSQIRPIQAAQNTSALVSSMDEILRENVLKSPSLAVAGRMAGDLLSFLPDVGPPDNRIIIAKLNLNIPLVTPSYQNLLSENWTGVEEDIQDALQHGVVHYPGTARPGQAGNFFVTGHSSYYPWAPGKYKNVFARLHELDVGDEYWVYYGGDKHRYIVRDKQEVKPSNVRVLDQPLDKRLATLMTCTPVGTTLRRLIITSEEIDPITGMPLDVGEKGSHGGQKLNVEQLPI